MLAYFSTRTYSTLAAILFPSGKRDEDRARRGAFSFPDENITAVPYALQATPLFVICVTVEPQVKLGNSLSSHLLIQCSNLANFHIQYVNCSFDEKKKKKMGGKGLQVVYPNPIPCQPIISSFC